MKKNLVMIFVLIAVLTLASASLAAERTVISVKVGINATGCELERIKTNNFGYFVNESTFHVKDAWGFTQWGSVTLVGLRKHTSIEGAHSYFGAGIGVTNYIYPTIDGHAGYEFHPNFLPDFLNARAEAGVSAVFGGWDGHALRPVIHFGAGVSYDFDWSILNL